jgi:dTDP-4-amino-4,6-dideoxygalactose transaminase
MDRRTDRLRKGLLTHSCTSALDLAALLLNLKSGDKVILSAAQA